MPWNNRFDEPDVIYHVYSRGVNRREIHMDAEDYAEFYKRIQFNLRRAKVEMLAWALMPNHFHFLLRRNGTRLATLMSRILTGFAMYFNERHAGVGHVFQGRYGSVPCLSDRYLYRCLKYIHLNPLKARLVRDFEELGRYPWCGHQEVMAGSSEGLLSADRVFDLFGGGSTGREGYERFMEEACGRGDWERPEPDFEISGKKDGPAPEERMARLSLLSNDFARRYGVLPCRMRARSKSRIENAAKTAFCEAALKEGHSLAEVASCLGVTKGAVWKRLRGGGIVPG